MKCQGKNCDADATIHLRHGDTPMSAVICAPCARSIALDMARLNIEGGGSVATTADGLFRYCAAIGIPMSRAEAVKLAADCASDTNGETR